MKVLAVDSNSIMNRAFYGIKMLSTKDGFFTNAIYGFLSILLSSIAEVKPDTIVFAFDMHAPTFRHKIYDEYKAGRHATPDELIQQFPVMKDLLTKLGYPVLETEGWEADDILGTISRLCNENNVPCVISTGDRDSLQLVTENTSVRLATTKMGAPVANMMTPDAIMEKYGVDPIDLIQVKALMGDSSDNIPGVPGIGEKTALDLIQKYKTVDYIYDNLDNLPLTNGVRKKLTEGKDSCYLSLKLGKIDKFAPISNNLDDYLKKETDENGAVALLAKLEMYKMIEKLGLDANSTPLVAEPEQETVLSPVHITMEECSAMENLQSCSPIGILYENDGDEITTVSLLEKDNVHIFENDGFFFNSAFSKILSNSSIKYVDDLKYLSRWAENYHTEIVNCTMDTGLAGYVLNVSGDDYSVEHLAMLYHAKSRKSNDFFENQDALIKKSLVFMDLCEKLSIELERCNELSLLNDIEIPLAKVLASMELAGFKIDPDGIKDFGHELDSSLEQIEKNIYEMAGETFNILSPKQLGVILFEKLGLPSKKKTKSGYSTSADVLEDLRTYHPIIDEILEYRKLSKLNSTYVEGLLSALSPDGRVHTRFNQKETRTGRISSLEPNLQNIPIRTEIGSRMRGFFVAKDGYILIDSDYSQIELRVLAHLSNDQNMCDAFRNGTDIHTQTASQVFGVPEYLVTSQMRSRAKAVNFGIVYGIGAFSLGENIDVSYKEAQQYINSYLQHYSGVDKYMNESIAIAKEKGYAVTANGRRRYLPELASSNHMVRSFGERVARNMPIQGTAADIIKLAMVNVNKALKNEKLDAKLIMQVHDELIVESNENCKDRVMEILKYEMENAVKLSVPMDVSISSGKTWLSAH